MIRFKLLSKQARLPTKAHATDAGYDLYSVVSASIPPGTSLTVPSGVACELPWGTGALVLGRSSMNRRGLLAVTGVIDYGYTGEMGIILLNTSGETQTILPGERIAQLVVTQVHQGEALEVARLAPSERGTGSFGSSGR